MDAKTINGIKARWNVYFNTIMCEKDHIVQLAHAQQLACKVPSLTEALEEVLADNAAKDAEIKRLTAELDMLGQVTVNVTEFLSGQANRRKARADMLKLALEAEATCTTCIYHGKAETEVPCCNCFGDFDYWQLDEVRFSADKEADCESNI